MKSFSSLATERSTKIFGVMVIAGLASGTASAQSNAPSAGQPAAVPASSQQTQPIAAMSQEERQKREEWQRAMSQVPLPKKGCFKADYPKMEWQEVPCIAGPNYPMPPRRGPRPFTVV